MKLFQNFRYFRFVSILITFLAAAFFLCACSKDEAIKPAALSNFKPVISVKKQWQNNISIGNATYLKLTPVFINNQVFIAGASGKVKSINSYDGKTLWQVSTRAPISSGVGANNSMLFVGTKDGRVLALAQKDGRILWQAKMSGEILAAPAANDEVVVAKTESGSLSAFNSKTGNGLWNYNQPGSALVLHGSSAPKIVGGVVLCGFANGEMLAFNIGNGRVLWQQQVAIPSGSFLVERMVDIIADPVVDGGVAYVVAYQGSITALSIKSGKIFWQKPMSSISGLSIDNKNIYVTDTDDRLWALDRYNGGTIWRKDIFANRGLSAPAVLNSAIAVGDVFGYIHWLNAANGQMVARVKVSGGINVPLAVYNNALYVYSVQGNLVKFLLDR